MDERMTMIKEILLSHISTQVGDIYNVDCKELGEAIDMIKDLEEACYYHTITEAMKKTEQDQGTYYYTEKYGEYPNKMYYDNDWNTSRMTRGNEGRDRQRYSEREMPITLRDSREGKSPEKRRMYMEAKELHMDRDTQMKDLEEYMQELTNDLMEMIKESTPEEKTMLQKKISTLATKINA